MKGFKLSPIHLPPIRRIKVKRTHYRAILGVASVLIFVAHAYIPDYEAHMALAVNMLFIVDPTA